MRTSKLNYIAKSLDDIKGRIGRIFVNYFSITIKILYLLFKNQLFISITQSIYLYLFSHIIIYTYNREHCNRFT
jgi:hypothetical protein